MYVRHIRKSKLMAHSGHIGDECTPSDGQSSSAQQGAHVWHSRVSIFFPPVTLFVKDVHKNGEFHYLCSVVGNSVFKH
jgi:hypothetical protein